VPLPPAPMLATAGQLPTNAQGWVAEAKLDGCRSMARVYGEGAQLFSRPGNQLSTRFPEITAALATALHGRTAILDGEIVTPDRRTGAPCFELLQRRLAVARPRCTLLASIPGTMCVFDILNLDGADLTQLTYLQRRAILEELPLRDTKAIAVPPVWPDLAADVLLDVTRELSLEGVVMKRAEAALAGGDLAAARGLADDAVSVTQGCFLSFALTGRARVLMAQGEPKQAESDAHDALTRAAEIEAHICVPDILEVLADLAGEAGSHREAARLFGAAEAIRERMGAVRFKIYDAGYEASVAAARDALGERDFDAAWAEGAALSTEEAIAYAQRGRGERKRATSGWASLTPTERDVVRLVSEGLGNNDIAARLFVSPRTVQSHLTHVYTKLGLTSRVRLAQEAARRT
jgi:DNA-binding CsgD family transcriptional regulator